jgi:hypothetical protein
LIRLRSTSAGSTRDSISANSIPQPNPRTPTRIESSTPTAKLRDRKFPGQYLLHCSRNYLGTVSTETAYQRYDNNNLLRLQLNKNSYQGMNCLIVKVTTGCYDRLDISIPLPPGGVGLTSRTLVSDSTGASPCRSPLVFALANND